MSWPYYNDDASDLVDGRRVLTITLTDRNGKVLAQKTRSFGGNDKNAEAYGVQMLAREAHRDAFYDRNRITAYVAPQPKKRSYLWGLIEVIS